MITVTEAANSKIKEIMKEQGEENTALRVIVTGQGCSGPQYMMTLDNETQTDDQTFESSGLKIVVDPDTASVLEGSQIDYLVGIEKSGFVISNPTFKMEGGGGGCGSCGCGK
jgi:iron-sulfur cluster assembly accessory protein